MDDLALGVERELLYYIDTDQMMEITTHGSNRREIFRLSPSSNGEAFVVDCASRLTKL